MNTLDAPNNKNVSRGMQGVFGMGDTGGQGYKQQKYFPDI
jgi:hypothetical protein